MSRPAALSEHDLAEENAAQWTAWAMDATAGVSDDTARRLHGNASIRFETTGGFDTALRYPPQYAADWDLSQAGSLHFSVYAENSNPGHFRRTVRGYASAMATGTSPTFATTMVPEIERIC